ncbi:amidohydrolase family protein [Streptomyces sp. NPDC088387]|uniref:amidohydrolase family protein n=1 Tax=Streptomyces sp. NPDC088387 TaxID=3365859 RepID=UPI00380E77BD
MFDGERVIAATDVMLEDGLIIAVGAAAAGAADVEIDARGETLMPGLIDAHTHTFDGSSAEALRYGVTSELDMFCLPRPLARYRELADHRDDVADLRSAGTVATAPGGHPIPLLASLVGTVIDPSDVTEIEFVTDPAQAPHFVRARLEEGADYLKIIIDDGTVHGTDLPVMTPAVATALTEAAHDAGLRVIAHTVTAAEANIALDAGVDGLAHVWADLAPKAPASRRLAERIHAQGVFVVTTLAYFEAITAQRPGTARCSHTGHYTNAVGALRALHRAGVPLLAGSDATPFVPAHGAGLHRELWLLTQAGLSAEEVLASATSVPALHFDLADRGRIAPGMRADLLLIEGDPTRDISALSSRTAVWRRGVRQAR